MKIVSIRTHDALSPSMRISTASCLHL